MAASVLESGLISGSSRRKSFAASADYAFEVLDRFAQALHRTESATQQTRLMLETIRQGVDADAVYFDGGDETESVVVGRTDLTPGWCTSLVQRLLAETPGIGSQLLHHRDKSRGGEDDPTPCSVAMVRASRTKDAWLVALRFPPQKRFQLTHVKIMSLARRLLVIHRQNAHTYGSLKRTLLETVRSLTAVIDARDPYTWGHSERVARIAVQVGRHMGLPEATLGDVYLGGLLHDIGKIGIRDSVLQKEGRLDEAERRHIESHTLIGDRLVANLTALAHLRPAVRNHHERWDGAGYPDRLAGEAIPFLARLIAVADACDAMMSDRPYRQALELKQVEANFRQSRGTAWDPTIVDHLLKCRDTVFGIRQRGLGESLQGAIQELLAASTDTSTFRPAAAGSNRAT